MTTYNYKEDPTGKSNLQYQIGAYANGVVYALHIFERRESLKQFTSRFTRPTELYKRGLKVDGVDGSEYGFESDTISAITQVFITSRHIYVFSAQGSSLGTPKVGMPIFFDSIRFAPPKTGVGIVDGPGEQSTLAPKPQNTNNDARVFSGREVTRKPIVVTKPEPSYTEDARRNGVMGTVVLRAVVSDTGAVTTIRAVSGLPNGLTERAIAAARQIKFIPAVKDERFVSMHIQLEYSFNLY